MKKILGLILVVIMAIACVVIAKNLVGNKQEEEEATTTTTTTSTATDENGTTEIKRDTDNNVNEVFNLTLKLMDDYDLDSDDFKVNKVLMLEDEANDYVYIQYTSGGETLYTCYTYDGQYFREEEQSTFEEEYQNGLYSKENSEEYNVYIEFTKKELKELNDMY